MASAPMYSWLGMAELVAVTRPPLSVGGLRLCTDDSMVPTIASSALLAVGVIALARAGARTFNDRRGGRGRKGRHDR